jgi:hypothetical protein
MNQDLEPTQSFLLDPSETSFYEISQDASSKQAVQALFSLQANTLEDKLMVAESEAAKVDKEVKSHALSNYRLFINAANCINDTETAARTLLSNLSDTRSLAHRLLSASDALVVPPPPTRVQVPHQIQMQHAANMPALIHEALRSASLSHALSLWYKFAGLVSKPVQHAQQRDSWPPALQSLIAELVQTRAIIRKTLRRMIGSLSASAFLTVQPQLWQPMRIPGIDADADRAPSSPPTVPGAAAVLPEAVAWMRGADVGDGLPLYVLRAFLAAPADERDAAAHKYGRSTVSRTDDPVLAYLLDLCSPLHPSPVSDGDSSPVSASSPPADPAAAPASSSAGLHRRLSLTAARLSAAAAARAHAAAAAAAGDVEVVVARVCTQLRRAAGGGRDGRDDAETGIPENTPECSSSGDADCSPWWCSSPPATTEDSMISDNYLEMLSSSTSPSSPAPAPALSLPAFVLVAHDALRGLADAAASLYTLSLLRAAYDNVTAAAISHYSDNAGPDRSSCPAAPLLPFLARRPLFEAAVGARARALVAGFVAGAAGALEELLEELHAEAEAEAEADVGVLYSELFAFLTSRVEMVATAYDYVPYDAIVCAKVSLCTKCVQSISSWVKANPSVPSPVYSQMCTVVKQYLSTVIAEVPNTNTNTSTNTEPEPGADVAAALSTPSSTPSAVPSTASPLSQASQALAALDALAR